MHTIYWLLRNCQDPRLKHQAGGGGKGREVHWLCCQSFPHQHHPRAPSPSSMGQWWWGGNNWIRIGHNPLKIESSPAVHCWFLAYLPKAEKTNTKGGGNGNGEGGLPSVAYLHIWFLRSAPPPPPGQIWGFEFVDKAWKAGHGREICQQLNLALIFKRGASMCQGSVLLDARYGGQTLEGRKVSSSHMKLFSPESTCWALSASIP